MVALPAVLLLLKVSAPKMTLLMVALPAVLLSKKSTILVVDDGGVAGRAGAVESRGCRRCVGDGGAAAVNDDAGAIEIERTDC